ncbi:MAG: DUF502 domain-containing protein [Acidobacteria bacterium]|nr:DUF502 domain-containing protein [Acidobacteriota bacterium]
MSDNNKPDDPLGVVEPPARQSLFDWLRERFVAGMLIALPIVATFVILEFLINLIDSRVVPLLPPALRPETYLDYAVPGFGLIILLLFLTLLGAVATNFLGHYFVSLTDRVLTRVPVVRSVYSVFKQIRDVFQSNSGGQYKEVVMVQYPKEGTWAIGFVAGAAKGEMSHKLGEGFIGVFVPTTPNPTSGFLLYVRASEVVKLDMTVEEGAKVIFSGGLVIPEFPRPVPAATSGK